MGWFVGLIYVGNGEETKRFGWGMMEIWIQMFWRTEEKMKYFVGF
jgi:hypothetical protein